MGLRTKFNLVLLLAFAIGLALAAYLYSRPAHAEALLLASDGYIGTTGQLSS